MPWTPPTNDRIVSLPAGQYFSMSVRPGDSFDIKLLSGGPLYWSHSLKEHPSENSYDDVLAGVNNVHTIDHPAWMVSPNDTEFDVIHAEPENIITEPEPLPPPVQIPESGTPPSNGGG
jgi:hypothetical protein